MLSWVTGVGCRMYDLTVLPPGVWLAAWGAAQVTRHTDALPALADSTLLDGLDEIGDGCWTPVTRALVSLGSLGDRATEADQLRLLAAARSAVTESGRAAEFLRTAESGRTIVEPGYVVHRRLHFEEKNAERARWDLGPLSVVVGAAYFYRDVQLWQQSLASGCVTGFWSTSAGKCLPGTPSSYYLYPVGLTVTGTAFETLVITSATFIFP